MALETHRLRNAQNSLSLITTTTTTTQTIINVKIHSGVDYGQSSTSSSSVSIVDDPVFGTQLQNVNELRVNSAEQAGFFLDAALAYRNDSKRI